MSLNESTKVAEFDPASILGISAAERDFACVRVAPTACILQDVDAIVSIPAGDVVVGWCNTSTVLRLDVTVPIGIHLQVRLPAKLNDELFIDGEPIADDTQTSRSEEFVELAVLPGSHYVFEVRHSGN